MHHRPRRRSSLWLALLLLIVVGPFGAAQEGPSEEGLPEVTPETSPESTETTGTIPAEILGRWFVVFDLNLPTGQRKSFARMFEIRPGEEHLEVLVGRRALPSKMNDAINAAGAAGRTWTPEPSDLRMIAARWDVLEPGRVGHTDISNKLIGADAFTAELKGSESTRDSRVVVSLLESFGGGSGITRTYTLLGVREIATDVLKGTFVSSSIAATPVPLPISVQGNFVAHRVGEAVAAPRPWWRRFFDLFAGCGCGRR